MIVLPSRGALRVEINTSCANNLYHLSTTRQFGSSDKRTDFNNYAICFLRMAPQQHGKLRNLSSFLSPEYNVG